MPKNNKDIRSFFGRRGPRRWIDPMFEVGSELMGPVDGSDADDLHDTWRLSKNNFRGRFEAFKKAYSVGGMISGGVKRGGHSTINREPATRRDSRRRSFVETRQAQARP
ncbi:hypothetical protein THAOC_07630, partial [Thalassiosira oceanica]